MSNNGFAHIPLPSRIIGRPKLHGGGRSNDQTKRNRNSRANHGAYIKRRVGELSRFWKDRREGSGLQNIGIGVPFLLQIDPYSDVEFLRGLGFEIVCSLDDGYIIVATKDVNLTTLSSKADGFINEINSRCNAPARIYAMCNDDDRLKHVLSNELYDKWALIDDNGIYLVGIGVSCGGNIPLPDKPIQKNNESDAEYQQRINKWQTNFNEAYQKWDDICAERQDEIIRFIQPYGAEIISSFVQEQDSFSFQLQITGKGLRDFVLNYPYVFEVSNTPNVQMESSGENTQNQIEQVTILSPDEAAPIICVIDSGIQEGHTYIAPAILIDDSICFIPNKTDVSDEVAGGGHGTRVAGAILYPNGIIRSGTYQLPSFIRNAKVLDCNNSMSAGVDPAKVVVDVVKKFFEEASDITKIFNQSISESEPFTCLKHMSSWAAQIDLQSYEKDILFIQAAGNISPDIIKSLIQAGYPYPSYFGKEWTRLANPAQSLQALTVGSVSQSDFETDDEIVMGKTGEVASFSRIGPGIWDTVKPDVVEFGGTYAINKDGPDIRLTTPSDVCPELIRRSPPGIAYDSDAIGTSFATPKVASIVAEISKVLPNSPSLLYRALVAQSARWLKTPTTPQECEDVLCQLGFGVPNVNRATHNDEYRITLITPEIVEIGANEAHLYDIKIPTELSDIGEDFDVLVEITLSYAAKPRRTRRYIKGYLSTWLDWRCSKAGESKDAFIKRIFETGGAVADDGNFCWMLGEQRGQGKGRIEDLARNMGTLQKDWCTVKSNQLTDEFCIAVRGHKGWGGLFNAKYSLAVSFEAINQDIAIYEPIRVLNEIEIENQEIDIEITDNE